jgi:hypothetical protein
MSLDKPMMNCGHVVLYVRWTLVAVHGAKTAPIATKIPAPRLLLPAEKREMTEVASYFRWTPIKNCDGYEIQSRCDAQFCQMLNRKVSKNVRDHEDGYFPREIPRLLHVLYPKYRRPRSDVCVCHGPAIAPASHAPPFFEVLPVPDRHRSLLTTRSQPSVRMEPRLA